MKKILCITMFFAISLSCLSAWANCPSPRTWNLMADQNNYVGSVSVTNDNESLIVTFSSNNEEIGFGDIQALAVLSLSDVPTNEENGLPNSDAMCDMPGSACADAMGARTYTLKIPLSGVEVSQPAAICNAVPRIISRAKLVNLGYEGGVVICHKPGTPAQKTMEVPESALQNHLDHGDFIGTCESGPCNKIAFGGNKLANNAKGWYYYGEYPICKDVIGVCQEFCFCTESWQCANVLGNGYFCNESGICQENLKPKITGPFVMGGPWLELRRITTIHQDLDILWTFDDDYSNCDDAPISIARYLKVGDTEWFYLKVETDPTGTWYARTVIPASSMADGKYYIQVLINDCGGRSAVYSRTHTIAHNGPDAQCQE